MAPEPSAAPGNQIFVSVRKGSHWPANVFDVRVKYEETIGDLKGKVCERLAIPVDKLLLFHHKKELTAAFDARSLAEMDMHTGFSLQGWDLTEEPEFWPPVKQSPEGLMIDC